MLYLGIRWGIMSCCCVQLLLISSLTAGEALVQLLAPNCSSDATYSSGSSYQRNRNKLLQNMTLESSKTGFYKHTEGAGSDQVYGSYLCQGRLPADNCSQCVSAAYNEILANCPNQIVAQTWYDQCILKYSNANFFGEGTGYDSVTWCSPGTYFNSSGPQLNNTLYGTLTKVAKQAAEDQTMFATMEVNLTFIHGSPTLYTSAQCVSDISADTCLQCLNPSINDQLPRFCDDTMGGRTVSSSCIIRYDVGRFYISDQVAATSPPTLPPVSPPTVHKGKGLYIILGILTPVVVLLILGMWCYLRNRKRLNDFEGIDMQEITAADSFQMDFNKVRAATRNFAPDKKLGEGGFGDVFMGTLENGQEIAVKRLTTSNSGQGAAEFKNEVVLVAKLQHRNLVKLLGFCLSGKEKILVYEYLPNSSLDKVLFDPIKRASLDWEKRFNIICGIAKGLLYLHEDSRLRIIHRDLKSSNVLLDEAMNPKISDFGIAKTLALDQTRASTGTLAGTYGYMAPEYVLTGQYSLKSDIYSFGIMVLEIVTGQRNRYGLPLLEEALLHRAWRLWNENAELEMVDSALNDAYSMEELVKCIHIGLLCIQEDAGKRPYMTSVVAALSGKSVDLPAPAPPNFFNISRSVSVISGSTSATRVEHFSVWPVNLDWTGPKRTGPDRTGPNRSGLRSSIFEHFGSGSVQIRSGPVRPGFLKKNKKIRFLSF